MPNHVSKSRLQGSPYPQGNQNMLQTGSPQARPSLKRPMKSNVSKIANGSATTEVVSDDSENEVDDGDCSAGKEHDQDSDDDEADDFALSDKQRTGTVVAACLAGLNAINEKNRAQEQAVTGAERNGSDSGNDDDDKNNDDEDYDAVEGISDSDESVADLDEKNILRSAEKDLIAEFERSEKPRNATAVASEMGEMSLMEERTAARRLSLQSEDSQLDDFVVDLDFSQDPFGGLSFKDTLYQELVEDAEDEFDNDLLASWRNPHVSASRENSVPSTSTQKKVRFEESPSSSASSVSSDEDHRGTFPDLFDEHTEPTLRQQMLHNRMNIDAMDGQESEYELEDEDEKVAFAIDAESDSDANMDDDSDDGDTTDEETPDEQLARVRAIRAAKHKLAFTNVTNSAPSTPVSSKPSTPVLARAKTASDRFTTPKAGARPKRGTFILDPTKASVTADVRGSGVKVVCPPQPLEKDREYWNRARQAIGSSDGSPGGSVAWTRSTPLVPCIPKRPLTAKSTLGTMFDGNLDFLRNNDESGIAKELLMFARKGSIPSSYTSHTMTDDGSDDTETNLNLADFVQIDHSDSEMEDPSSTASASVFSPSQDHFSDSFFESSPVTSRDNGPGLLDHFDQQRGLVSSFRNNQQNARHVSSLAAHPAQRAQTSEANALQHGRRSAANTPMTPARKKRPSQDLTGAGVRKLVSPLAQQKHYRRSRGSSLSGIHQTLALDRFGNDAH